MKILTVFLLIGCSICGRILAAELSNDDLTQIRENLEPIDYLEKITLHYDDQLKPFSKKQGKLLSGLARKVHDLPINLLIESFSINSVLEDGKHKEISDAKYQELLGLLTQAKGLPAEKILYYYAGKNSDGVFGARNIKGEKNQLVISFLRDKNSAVPLQDLLKEFRQRGFDVSLVRSVTPRGNRETEAPLKEEIHKNSSKKINIAINFPTSLAMNNAAKRGKGIGFFTELFLFNSTAWGVNLSYRSFDYQTKPEKLDEFQFGGIYAINFGNYEFMTLDFHSVFNVSASQVSTLSGTILENETTTKKASELGISFIERATASFLIPGLSYRPLVAFELRLAKSYIDLGFCVGVGLAF